MHTTLHTSGFPKYLKVLSKHPLHTLFFRYIQGDLCNSDECFLEISLKLVKVHTIKFHSAKEAEFNGILFGTWD